MWVLCSVVFELCVVRAVRCRAVLRLLLFVHCGRARDLFGRPDGTECGWVLVIVLCEVEWRCTDGGEVSGADWSGLKWSSEASGWGGVKWSGREYVFLIECEFVSCVLHGILHI